MFTLKFEIVTELPIHVYWDPPPLDYEFKPITTRPPRPHVSDVVETFKSETETCPSETETKPSKTETCRIRDRDRDRDQVQNMTE